MSKKWLRPQLLASTRLVKPFSSIFSSILPIFKHPPHLPAKNSFWQLGKGCWLECPPPQGDRRFHTYGMLLNLFSRWSFTFNHDNSPFFNHATGIWGNWFQPSWGNSEYSWRWSVYIFFIGCSYLTWSNQQEKLDGTCANQLDPLTVRWLHFVDGPNHAGDCQPPTAAIAFDCLSMCSKQKVASPTSL